MSNYRRLYIPGGTYFFTIVTDQRRHILCTEFAINRLRSAFAYTKQKLPFVLESLVVLPDHLHCIWQLPNDDDNYSVRWNMIKRFFSIGIQSDSNHRREKNIWQRRFWEHAIRNEEELEKCFDYIYYNPVKHGYVQKPSDWPYSTLKRDISKGFYDTEWGSNADSIDIDDVDWE